MSKEEKDIYSQANDPGKYIKLFGIIMISFFSFLVALVLLFLFMKLVFGILPYLSWLVYVYMVIIIVVPATLFITIFLIFFARTKKFNPKYLRYIFLSLFILLIATWAIVFVTDIYNFIKFEKTDIKDYLSFNMYLLFGNVAIIFLIGIIQALSAPKRQEWSDKIIRHNQLN